MPSKSKSKGRNGKKVSKKSTQKSTPPAVEPVVEQAVEPVVEPAVEPTVEPVVEQATAPTKQKGGKRKAKVVQQTTETEQVTEAFTETATATATETQTGGRRTRSFKVLLPDSEEYEGRFTGLTPYQAANKALSKYYRETQKPKKQIQFSIRESTRGSRRNVYTYNGRREKLKTPVEYQIKPKDGGEARVIVKNYKNRLTKVKKAELTETATA